jgi:nucleoside-diphosphate-sugar epimerase
MYTIIGTGGAIANELVSLLSAHKERIRLISRSQVHITGTENRIADLLSPHGMLKAIEGSAVVYMMTGITYEDANWWRDWPQVMKNVIAACKHAGARLIYLDCADLYGRVEGVMTEETPVMPVSRNGRITAEIFRMLQREMTVGTAKIAIARYAEIYGSCLSARTRIGQLVFEKLKRKTGAQWLINADVPHAFNYTPDVVRALYILGLHEQSCGQVWHMPAAKPALNGRQFTAIAAHYMRTNGQEQVLPQWIRNILNRLRGERKVQRVPCPISADGGFSAGSARQEFEQADLRVIPKWQLKIRSWLDREKSEYYEMSYRDEFPFRFDSSKFENAFQFKPTSYHDGIKATVRWFSNNYSY